MSLLVETCEVLCNHCYALAISISKARWSRNETHLELLDSKPFNFCFCFS